MGTSKGYIAPTRSEWSKAKRAVSVYLKTKDSESRANAVSEYAKAMRTGGTGGGSSFSSAVGNVLSFSRNVANNGINEALNQFGRNDLIGKPPEIIVHELLDHFTNHGSTAEDSLVSAALSSAFEVMNIETPDDLGKMDLDAFLLEVIISFINYDFDFRFNEKISQGRTPEDTLRILNDVHGYIDGTLRNKLTPADVGRIDLTQIETNKIVSDMLNDAFSTCMTFYGDEA